MLQEPEIVVVGATLGQHVPGQPTVDVVTVGPHSWPTRQYNGHAPRYGLVEVTVLHSATVTGVGDAGFVVLGHFAGRGLTWAIESAGPMMLEKKMPVSMNEYHDNRWMTYGKKICKFSYWSMQINQMEKTLINLME